MLTLLFDIDGTLIDAGGAGTRAMQQTMADLFGVDKPLDVQVSGRTDHSIISDFFSAVSLDVNEHRQRFCVRYCQLLKPMLAKTSGVVLPGVVELLDSLQANSEVTLGLLTGNLHEAADLKLKHYGLSHYFSFGGFGDHHSNRNDVAAVACDEAWKHLGQRFRDDLVWVIGDTVNDVLCARSVDANVIAVETGGGTPEQLRAAEPDVQYSRLPDPQQFLNDLLRKRAVGTPRR